MLAARRWNCSNRLRAGRTAEHAVPGRCPPGAGRPCAAGAAERPARRLSAPGGGCRLERTVRIRPSWRCRPGGPGSSAAAAAGSRSMAASPRSRCSVARARSCASLLGDHRRRPGRGGAGSRLRDARMRSAAALPRPAPPAARTRALAPASAFPPDTPGPALRPAWDPKVESGNQKPRPREKLRSGLVSFPGSISAGPDFASAPAPQRRRRRGVWEAPRPPGVGLGDLAGTASWNQLGITRHMGQRH